MQSDLGTRILLPQHLHVVCVCVSLHKFFFAFISLDEFHTFAIEQAQWLVRELHAEQSLMLFDLSNPSSQVKIWFQNRRAKERKQVKKREEVVMKEKGDHASLQHAQLHHATMLHHQQMMNGMMHHHHYHHQGVLQGVPEPLVPGVPPVPLLWPRDCDWL